MARTIADLERQEHERVLPHMRRLFDRTLHMPLDYQLDVLREMRIHLARLESLTENQENLDPRSRRRDRPDVVPPPPRNPCGSDHTATEIAGSMTSSALE